MSSCQTLAEVVASQYYETLDSGQTHPENVRTNLRSKLLSATAGVLTDGRAEVVESSGRTMARLDAFLEGCILAVPVVEESRYESVVDMKRANMSSKPENHGLDMSLLSSALAGFSIHDPTTANGDSNKHLSSHRNHLVSSISSTLTSSSSSSTTTSSYKKQYPQIPSNTLISRLTFYFKTLKRVNEVKKAIMEGRQVSASDGECVIQIESSQNLKTHISLLIQAFVATAGCISSMRHILTNLLSHLTMQLLAVSTLCDSLKANIRDLVLAYEHLTCFASLAFLSTPKESAETKLAPLVSQYLDYLRSEWKSCVSSCHLELFLSLSIDANLRSTFKTIEFQSISHLLDVCQYHRQSLEHIHLVDMDSSYSHNKATDTDESSIQQALRDLRREVITVNGRVLPPVTSLRQLVKTLKSILNARTLKLKESKTGHRHSRRGEPTEEEEGATVQNTLKDASTDDSSETDFTSSENECQAVDSNSGTLPLQDRQKSNTTRAIDTMTRRLIVAASRSEKGGDAYFVVRDLFGDETVDIVPVSRLSDPFLSWFQSSESVPRGSIELLVRLSSVVIKVHACFYVYPKHHRGESDPLIQIHTSTTETIFLHEVRVDEHSRKVMLTEKHAMDTRGTKILSIRPAKYERVGNG